MLIVLVVSCKISYKFNGGVIDYAKTKSISIVDFPNNAELIYPTLAQTFTEKLRDAYQKQTRLQLLKKGGDMHIEGEITGYQLTPMGVGTDTYATQTKLTVTINVRFTNFKNSSDDFERTYSAFKTYDNTQNFTDVQDELVKAITEEIVDLIYNDTVAKW